MKYQNLGRTGIKVSRICLGMMSFGNTREWNLEHDEAKPIIDKALDAGINFFDTANVYATGRSEEITGELLKDHRDDVVIATKVRFPMGEGLNEQGLNRYHVSKQIKASLKRLQTDVVDLYQIHRWDYNVDIEYVMRTLNHVIDEGQAHHIGASSMFAWELAKAQYTAERLGLEGFSTMQNHYNAVYREEEREMLPLCIDQGMGVIPWSPLARGFLSGKYSNNEKSTRSTSDRFLEWFGSENDFEILKKIEEGAKENNISVSQMSLAWLLDRPGVTSPILGVTKLKHLEEAIEVVDMSIDQDYFNRISEAYTVRPVKGHSYTSPLGDQRKRKTVF